MYLSGAVPRFVNEFVNRLGELAHFCFVKMRFRTGARVRLLEIPIHLLLTSAFSVTAAAHLSGWFPSFVRVQYIGMSVSQCNRCMVSPVFSMSC